MSRELRICRLFHVRLKEESVVEEYLDASIKIRVVTRRNLPEHRRSWRYCDSNVL
jgi:hypothetical protein